MYLAKLIYIYNVYSMASCPRMDDRMNESRVRRVELISFIPGSGPNPEPTHTLPELRVQTSSRSGRRKRN
ncbi:hypothetical protein Hdeb2414_s0005g00187141 [Helianthus debilis subsp. tardiflorus]